MAPRLKIFMASGSKKGTCIYFSFLSKVPTQTNPFQIPQKGPYEERGSFAGHFAYPSKTSSFVFPNKEALPQGSLHGIPRREMPHY
jgi:hypothetical protein